MIKEVLFTVVAILLSFCAMVYCEIMVFQTSSLFGQLVYLICTGFICLGNFIYFTTRLGYLKRRQEYTPTAEEDLEKYYRTDFHLPSLTFLVPSYKEEMHVVKQTLLSSALQDYPNRKVVLLIDDPHNPNNPQDREKLEETRGLPTTIAAELAPVHQKLTDAFDQFISRKKSETIQLLEEHQILAQLHRYVAEWFINLSKQYDPSCHIDKTFIDLNVNPRLNIHLAKVNEALAIKWSLDDLEREYSYLRSLFNVQISFFERKKYQNLSHAPNKAMNLNSYLNLMGKSYSEDMTDKGEAVLVEQPCGRGSLYFPDSDYIAMLDADTILTHHYAIQLVHIMEKTENHKIAVVQTPYSAFPNSPNNLERIAGATTDVLYITHQGFTLFNATFWVGANALVRKIALDEIAETFHERGYNLTKYIQDNTVIEDTESSVDLVDKGWKLYNHPERLSYSATPHDFGSLLIQRRRWANGGLLIIPKLFRYLIRRPWSFHRMIETLFRFHYLFSLTAMMFVVPALTIYSFISYEYSKATILLSLPYFWLYGRDLSFVGYSFKDLFKVIALNLLLFPINCAGVIKSIHQAVTGKQTPFCRTPKIAGRTSVPKIYNIITVAMICLSLITFIWNIFQNGWVETGLFALFMVVPFLYGTVVFMGWKNIWADCRV